MSEPRKVGEVLGGMIQAGGWRDRIAGGRLRAAWPEIVGAGVASHSEPVRIINRCLLIRAESGAWATELALLAPSLATAADAWLGGGLVDEVKVVAGR